MPPRNQAKSYRQRLDEVYDEMLTNAATKADVKEIVDIFVKEFQKISALLSEKMAENKAEMSTETSRLGSQVAEFEKRMRGLSAGDKQSILAKLDILGNELRAEIDYVEDGLKTHTHLDLIRSIGSLRETIESLDIPEAFDATELVETQKEHTETLEDHEKRIDALEKRPIGRGGGGTTDMRIRQAMKNIVLTEALVGDIDGVNTSYTVSQPIFAVLNFSINGEFIAQLPNYTISNRTITFSTALPAVYSGKDFELTYFG